MSEVFVIVSWPPVPLPQTGVYEVYTHDSNLVDADVSETATLVNELQGHRTVLAVTPNTTVYCWVRYRNEQNNEYSSWIKGSISVGASAVRGAVAPLAVDAEDRVRLNSLDAHFELNGDNELRIKDGVFVAVQSATLTDANTNHSMPVSYDAAALNAALDALGERINALQAVARSAGLGQ